MFEKVFPQSTKKKSIVVLMRLLRPTMIGYISLQSDAAIVIGVMSQKPQEQSLNNQSKRRATTTKTHITENNIKSLCLNVINFWYHTIYQYVYKEGVLYFSIYSLERPIREWLYGYMVMFGHLTKQQRIPLNCYFALFYSL